jgi:hypothetical protein
MRASHLVTKARETESVFLRIYVRKAVVLQTPTSTETSAVYVGGHGLVSKFESPKLTGYHRVSIRSLEDSQVETVTAV